ncbi:MAG TPA: formylmethanofuran dehydrogenase subunit A [Dongiaceae bacterium]|jgi:formylmethanofuran dehydrogenase subunit A
MTLVKLAGGRIFDPANGRSDVAGDIFIRDGRIAADPGGAKIDQVIDISGRVVMAGGIDIHSHICGGKMNLARTLMLGEHREHRTAATDLTRAGSGHFTPSTAITGYRYAEMGYTAAFEPAMVASNARQAHAELADTPMIDKGCYVVLGNEDVLLRLLAERASQSAINDYVGWMLKATQALAIKAVNPGGISAFKFNGRDLGFDSASPHYGLTPRQIVTALAQATHDLGLAHPLHLHCNDLGVPGNLSTTLRTMESVDGLPLHLTHVQFHSYGTEGDRKFSTGAAAIAEVVNKRPNISIDVGQIMFGQTITASADSMTQHRNRGLGRPRKWVCMDIECQAGCGLVPFQYRDRNFVNALQWAIGLELLLLVQDPWRVFLTTDHPNGAPFTTYPHLIRLLMDRDFRDDRLRSINKHAAAASHLRGIKREYTLSEIAILTRAGPARILGLSDRGHLGPGAAADIVVYADRPDREAMFAKPDYVFKDGRIVVRDGKLVEIAWGATHVARPSFDSAVERKIGDFFERFQTMRSSNFAVADGEIEDATGGRLVKHDSDGARGP